LVALATEVLERLRPLYPTLRGAALSDPEVAAAHERFTLQGRLDDLRPFVRRLVALGALDPDLDEDRATDVVWTLLSPDAYELLVGYCGWSPYYFGAWVMLIVVDALVSCLAPTDARPRSREATSAGWSGPGLLGSSSLFVGSVLLSGEGGRVDRG